jgi:hypothetical protein
MNDFYKAIDQTAAWMGDLIYQSCETLVKEMEDVAAEMEDALDFYLEPVLDWLGEIEDIISDTGRPFVQTVTPALQDHPNCVGCSHYHGEAYGGNVLVCAMHPYGVEESSGCPDWESVWRNDFH